MIRKSFQHCIMATICLQKNIRRRLAYLRLLELKRRYKSAVTIQRFLSTKIKRIAYLIMKKAASTIIRYYRGYKSRKKNVAGFYSGNDRKVHGATIICPTNGEMKFVSEKESKYPTFLYNLDTGKKACFVDPGSDAEYLCPNGEW